MSNQPPLNPGAFLAAKDAAREAIQADQDWHDVTTAMLSAYLTVAQPVVNSVEELDQLPVGSVVLDVYGASVTKVDLSVSSPWIHETIRWFRVTSALESGYQYRTPHLPARVLYRPEVKP